MVSDKNYNLNANEGPFDFQVSYMIYWRFHFKNEIPINCLFTLWKWK